MPGILISKTSVPSAAPDAEPLIRQEGGTALVFENLTSVLAGLADLCAIIQSDIGTSVAQVPDISNTLMTNLQNIDRLQQNLEGLSAFHRAYAKLCPKTPISQDTQEFLEKQLELASLKARIFPDHHTETHKAHSGEPDYF